MHDLEMGLKEAFGSKPAVVDDSAGCEIGLCAQDLLARRVDFDAVDGQQADAFGVPQISCGGQLEYGWKLAFKADAKARLGLSGMRLREGSHWEDDEKFAAFGDDVEIWVAHMECLLRVIALSEIEKVGAKLEKRCRQNRQRSMVLIVLQVLVF